MKKFIEKGVYFALSAFRITAIPIKVDDADSVDLICLAKTICEDACYLSSDGNGQSSVEILRIADDHIGSEIQHLMTVRTYGNSENNCVIRQEAIVQAVISLLHHNGFETAELSFTDYRSKVAEINTESVWAIRKQDIQEYGVQRTYKSPPVIEAVDWKQIYTSLDGSGCSICIQIIPALLTQKESLTVMKKAADSSQAVDGFLPNMRDGIASAPAGNWKYYAQRKNRPFAHVNIIVSGSQSGSAMLAARMRQSVSTSSFSVHAISGFNAISIYNQPWKIASMIKGFESSVMDKWTSDEVSLLFQLPYQGTYFSGVRSNAFSLLPEKDLIPSQILFGEQKSIKIGQSVFSDKTVYFSLDQLLLHTSVLGKTGVGKTTFLKQLITELHHNHIPVFIMEPVKREYRNMSTVCSNMRVFTVERPVVPLLINPFRVPDGVTLGDYRSHLLSAFKAAFSLPDPLPSLFEKAISEAYLYYGWTDVSKSNDPDVTVFDMADFIRIFKSIIANSSYSSEVKGNMMSGGAFRLQSLIDRCPRTFDTINSTDVKDLLSCSTILEMGNLEPEQKSLVSALILISILAYLKATRTSSNVLRNVILIDEAHALLDQGENHTEEEKALSNAMSQLIINIITEIRAYGVGVIFSDQSPSRVGSSLIDNVDNLVSFRLSGEESRELGKHVGDEEIIPKILPLLSTGEMVVKNRFLHHPLAVKMVSDFRCLQNSDVTDDQVVQKCRQYLLSNADKYMPFAICKLTGCKNCSVGVRDEAHKYAVQMFKAKAKDMNNPEAIASQIISIPEILHKKAPVLSRRLSECTATHLLRLYAVQYGITFSDHAVESLLTDMNKRAYIREES